MLDRQRQFFRSGVTRSLEFRLENLKKLGDAVAAHEADIFSALKSDLGKSKVEAYTSEISLAQDEIRFARKNLKKWMRAKGVSTPMTMWPARSSIVAEPLGTVLIIGPWNYPVQLTIVPLIGAIAAGNTAIVKPSELAPASSRLIAKILGEIFPPEYVQVVEGGVPETTKLLEQRFDHIFFTGSTPVGKIVALAAAKHLTPTTLELGGKSPTIVDRTADLDLSARRIAWAKLMNAGQTCVAPDYLYVHQDVATAFLEKLKAEIHQQYGDASKSPDYGRIVNERNFDRLMKLIDPAKVSVGGGSDRGSKYIEPTVLKNVTWNDAVMNDEIFGPILPVMTYADISEVFAEILKREKPLAAYLYSEDSELQKKFVDEISFGGGCINDSNIHLGNVHLPFGGVGSSGSGAYHGFESFRTFSHFKSVLKKSRFLDVALRYPPYSEKTLSLLKKVFG